jgi:hypothetical protein
MPLQTALQIKIRWFKFFGHFKLLFRFQSILKFEYVQMFLENGNELMGVMRKSYWFDMKCEFGVLKMESKF